jgi:hypothetical protein
LLNKNPLNLPYHAWGACFNPYKAFLYLCTQCGSLHSQSPVVASHEPLPPKTHSRRHCSHPFGTVWTL